MVNDDEQFNRIGRRVKAKLAPERANTIARRVRRRYALQRETTLKL